jgi:hypothetical protein
MTQEQIDGVVLEGFVEHVDDECHDVAFQVLLCDSLGGYLGFSTPQEPNSNAASLKSTPKSS